MNLKGQSACHRLVHPGGRFAACNPGAGIMNDLIGLWPYRWQVNAHVRFEHSIQFAPDEKPLLSKELTHKK